MFAINVVIILHKCYLINNQNQRKMLKGDLFSRPLSWIIFILISFVAVLYTYQNFDKATSLVSLSIEMDRESALEKATSLAKKYSLGPEEFKQSAAFDRDSRFQTFVELEAGGLDTFKNCIEKGNYHAYYWEVRHFKEQEANEVSFWFTPSGSSYGFAEKIAESEEGEALSEEEALKIAEHYATYNWDVDLSTYKVVEKSKEEQISGRVDHTFVYERDDIEIGEGKFRLELVVSGDNLTTVNYFVKIPEDFDRRYSEMRSDNDTIATVASGIIALIYGLIGVVIGIFFLMRRRYLIWKKPVLWGTGIAMASVFLLTINNLPFSWFNYDTSTSQTNFLVGELMNGLLGALGFGAIIAVSTMAGEGLGRIAFPKQIQFWKLWSKDVVASKQILGQTISGYLFAIIILAVDVLFYMITTKHFGWWSPAGSLSDPNILANYLPWFDSIAISLQAGFWEEVLFRAVPIAGIFILVKNKKSRNFWIILVLLFQTLVFGAAHANYPNQPSYARVLEMIIPFTIMGIIYIYYGLLPAIIAHYAIDVFWISLPLWVSSVPGIWVDRIMVLLFLFIPIWIIIYFFLKNKKLKNVPDEARNGAWEAPEVLQEDIQEEDIIVETKSYNLTKWLIPAGVLGFILWLVFAPFRQDAPKLDVTRSEAIQSAKIALQEDFNMDANQWTALTSVSAEVDIKDIFIWREGGKEAYQNLLGDFLGNPYWVVRFVKTSGEVEERAEEFTAYVSVGNKVTHTFHKVPEKREGAKLSKDSAQVLVDQALHEKYQVGRDILKEISVTPKKLENRTDWEFIYADTINYPVGKGQGRFMVAIAGDEINKALKYVHVPEDWIREYKEEQSKESIIKTIGRIFTIGIIMLGLVLCIVRWTKRKFNTKVFVIIGVVIALLFAVDIVNSWASIKSGYSTLLPYANFITMMLISVVLVGLFWSFFNAIFIGATIKWLPVASQQNKRNIVNALVLGVFAYGFFTLVQGFAPKTEPNWISISALNTDIPVIGFALSDLFEALLFPALMILIFIGIHHFSKGFTIRKFAVVGLTIFISLAISTSASSNILFWVISAFALGGLIIACYLFFIRQHFEWLPLTFGIFQVLEVLEVMVVNPFPAAIPGGIIFVVLVSLIYYYWYQQLVKQSNT